MNIEGLSYKLEDTGIKDNTLAIVLSNLLTNGTVDVRKLKLPNDKDVNYENNFYLDNNLLISNQILIYRTIINKIEKNGINNSILENLKIPSLTQDIINELKNISNDQLNKLYSSQGNTYKFSNKAIEALFYYIFNMSRLNDMYGSHQVDIFETKIQKTITDKKIEDYTKRIYLNIPLNKTGIEFLTLFKLKCIKKGLPSKMKGMGSSGFDVGELDTTIIYSNDFYLIHHIQILEEIILERPDLVGNFGTPVISGARSKSNDGNCYYTISSGLLANLTSNGYYDKLYKISFALLCLKYKQNININDYKTIKECIELKKHSIDEVILNNKEMLKRFPIENLLNEYKTIVKNVSSVLRYNDMEHIETPLYQDKLFSDFLIDNKKEEINTDDNKEKNIYLYNTEDLINEVLHLYEQGDVSFDKLIENYINRINEIYKKFKFYALREPAFVSSERYKNIINIFSEVLVKEYIKADDDTKIDKLQYYQQVQSKINNYLNNNKENANKRII